MTEAAPLLLPVVNRNRCLCHSTVAVLPLFVLKITTESTSIH